MWAEAHMMEIQEAMMCLAFAHIPIDDDHHDDHTIHNGGSGGHDGGDDDNDDDTGVADMKEGRDGKSSDEKLTPLRTSSPSVTPSPPSSATGSGHVSRSTSSSTISSTATAAAASSSAASSASSMPMSPQRSASNTLRRPSLPGTPVHVTASPRRSPSSTTAATAAISNGNGHSHGNGHSNGDTANGTINGHHSNGDQSVDNNNNSLMAKYRRYMSLDRWHQLSQLFRADLYALNGLPSRSLLSIHLQAGLAALKTPYVSHPCISMLYAVLIRYEVMSIGFVVLMVIIMTNVPSVRLLSLHWYIIISLIRYVM